MGTVTRANHFIPTAKYIDRMTVPTHIARITTAPQTESFYCARYVFENPLRLLVIV